MILAYKEDRCDLSLAEQFGLVIDQVRGATNADELFEDLQGPFLSLLDGDRATFYMLDGQCKVLKSVRKTGSIPSQIRVPVDKKSSVAGFVAATGRVISIVNAYDNVELMTISPDLKFDGSWDRLSCYHTRQILAAPILACDKIIGVIQVINKAHGNRFTPLDRQIISKTGFALGEALRHFD